MTRPIFRSIRRDQRGVAIIELAMTAPILAAMVIGMSDLARAYSIKLQLEQAAQRSIEMVENQKNKPTDSTGKLTYNTVLTTEAGNAMIDAGYTTGNTVTPDSWLECSTDGTTWTRQADIDGSCPNAGDVTARYVKLTIARDYVPIFPSRAWPGANAAGNIPITGTAEVRIQ